MKRRRHLGLDELMIVNPGPRGGRVGAAYLLADDNRLYRVERPRETAGRFFLGDDGTLYEVVGPRRATGTCRCRR